MQSRSASPRSSFSCWSFTAKSRSGALSLWYDPPPPSPPTNNPCPREGCTNSCQLSTYRELQPAPQGPDRQKTQSTSPQVARRSLAQHLRTKPWIVPTVLREIERYRSALGCVLLFPGENRPTLALPTVVHSFWNRSCVNPIKNALNPIQTPIPFPEPPTCHPFSPCLSSPGPELCTVVLHETKTVFPPVLDSRFATGGNSSF